MKTFLILSFTLLTSIGFAQKTVVWKGGTPGKENCWHEARNWSTNSVPDEFSNVIIPDVSSSSFSTPIIYDGTVELNALQMETNTHLSILRKAKLIVYSYSYGLDIEKLQLEGTLILLDELTEEETILANLENK